MAENLGNVIVSAKDIPEVRKALEFGSRLLKAARRVTKAADELNLDHSPKSLEFINGLAALEDLLDEIEENSTPISEESNRVG